MTLNKNPAQILQSESRVLRTDLWPQRLKEVHLACVFLFSFPFINFDLIIHNKNHFLQFFVLIQLAYKRQ